MQGTMLGSPMVLVAAVLLAAGATARAASLPASQASLRPAEHLRPGEGMDVERPQRGAEILEMPGYRGGRFPSRHFGGYITVDEKHGRRLFYYFVESQRSPSKDPVMLWLNGGPGCSSFDGFVYEHGPFKMSFKGGKDATGRRLQELELRDNPYSWSTVANVLYVDSPAGVGMSYSATKADYHTNDTQTVRDLDTFLRRWFAEYAEFQGNDFFIAGESFAGVYVPLTAQAVLDGNDAGQEPALRLRGYLVGNGVTDPRFDGNALVPFAYGKSLISAELYQRAAAACNGAFWNATDGSECDAVLEEVWHKVSGINLYNVLEGCYHGRNPYTSLLDATHKPGGAAASDTSRRADLAAALASHRQWPLLGGLRQGPVPGFGDLLGPQLGHTPPCLDSREMWAFCNSPEVRQAIHAEPIDKIGAFDECTNGARIRYTHNIASMLPVHKDIISRGLSGLIYSGDHDMAVPHTGSEAWTSWLGAQLGVERPWAPWHIGDHQVAGYAVHYRGLTYATVRGAGHMVPEDKPAEALRMVSRFLDRLQLQ